MGWLLRTFDRLIGTVIAAFAGLGASQTQAFIAAYLQRLGGHLDEARRSLVRAQSGELLPGADPASQDRIAGAFSRRVDELTTAYHAVADADAFRRPFEFARHFDRDIADATLSGFTPALPLDTASAVYILVGIVVGWLCYELIKLPFRLVMPRRRWA
jgi:hypothetical protein